MTDDFAAMARTFRLGVGLPAPRPGEDWTDVALRALEEGRGPVVPRFLRRYLPPKTAGRVLDFGAGAAALQVRALLRLGYDVDGYDWPSSEADLESDESAVRARAESYFRAVDDEVLDPDALEGTFDVVLASNVLNVQPTIDRLFETLCAVKRPLRPRGVFVANLPEDPRLAFAPGRRGERELERVLREAFAIVRRLDDAVPADELLDLEGGRRSSATVWVCR